VGTWSARPLLVFWRVSSPLSTHIHAICPLNLACNPDLFRLRWVPDLAARAPLKSVIHCGPQPDLGVCSSAPASASSTFGRSQVSYPGRLFDLASSLLRHQLPILGACHPIRSVSFYVASYAVGFFHA
jgi:hypothetical protein